MLVDETVMITGASSGIGAACARAFAHAGARLILCARREDRLAEVADSLDAETHLLVLDVRDRAAVQAAIALLGPSWSDVDVLVNNAGLAAGFEPLLEGDPDDWDRMMDTNVRGLLDVTRAVVPRMVQRGRGHVINIGSIAGRETYPGGVVYCASKAAVDRITRGLRMELLGTGVKVSTIDPGLVETEFSVVRFHGDMQQGRCLPRRHPVDGRRHRRDRRLGGRPPSACPDRRGGRVSHGPSRGDDGGSPIVTTALGDDGAGSPGPVRPPPPPQRALDRSMDST